MATNELMLTSYGTSPRVEFTVNVDPQFLTSPKYEDKREHVAVWSYRNGELESYVFIDRVNAQALVDGLTTALKAPTKVVTVRK